MRRLTVGRKRARQAAVLAACLGASVSGTMLVAGQAWSEGPMARIAGHGHHRRSGGASGNTATITTTVTTTKTVTTTTSTPRTTTQPKASTKPKPKAKPKPKPKPKPPVRLTATLSSATTFPERVLGLWSSTPRGLTAAQVHVSENGRPVTALTLQPLSGSKDFGVIVVVDESASLSSNSRGQELAAVDAVAAQRMGQEMFGVIGYSATPTMMVPLSNNKSLISEGLGAPPLVAPGTSLLPALTMAYEELHRAGLAAGAVIVVTSGKDLASPTAEAALSQTGLRMGYQTFATDILTDPASDKSTKGTDGDADAAQEAALGAEYNNAAGIWSRLNSGYLARYRSTAKPGQQVTVTVNVDGLAGTPTLTYTASRATVSSSLTMPPLSQLPVLSREPGFAQYVPAAAPVAPQRASTSFWSSSLSLVMVSLICALLIAGSLWLLVGGAARSELETRVSSFIPDAKAEEEAARLAVLAEPGVPPMLARRRWWPGLVLSVDVARFRQSPVRVVKITAAASVVAGILLTFLLGSVIGFLLGLALGPIVLWALLKRGVRKTRDRFADQLPSSLQDMAGAVRGGRSLAGAIAAVTDGAEEPILGEYERIIADEQLGRPLEDSVHTVAQRMRSEDMEQMALVATLHRRSGSSVAEALDHVAEGARERSELIRELKSLTGQARLSSWILTALPIALLIAMFLLEPNYMHPLIHTTGGIIVLVFCLAMVLVGWLLMKRIVKVEA